MLSTESKPESMIVILDFFIGLFLFIYLFTYKP